MNQRKLALILGAALVTACLGVAGCGSSNDNKGGGAAECHALCDAQTAGGCALLSAADCKQLCDAVYSSVSASCQAKWEASSKCQSSQPDVCDTTAVDTACQSENDAANNCQ